MKRRLPHAAPSTAPWSWAWWGALLGLGIALISFAPARWLAWAVSSASAERVVLTETRGTVWDGTARLVLAGGAGSRDAVRLPGLVRWTLRPGWGKLQLGLTADCCMSEPLQLSAAPLGWGGARLDLGSHQSRWSAALLTGLGTPWNTVQPQGELRLALQQVAIEWARGRLQLNGRCELDAIDISSRLTTIQPMGSYRVTLEGGGGVRIGLQTLGGSLQLAGQGQWLGQSVRFDGVASAAEGRVDALSNLLNIIGRREGARSIIRIS